MRYLTLAEFADQDPTPLVRVYGDGRVEVYFAAYMKRAGRYELRLSAAELETLLLELTPVLLAFDEAEVETQRRGAEAVLRAEAVERGGPSLFHVTDAETSVFHLNVDSYRPPGSPGLTISKPALDRTWRGLRYDAERYSDLGPVQSLFEVESTLRALAEREELVRIGEPE